MYDTTVELKDFRGICVESLVRLKGSVNARGQCCDVVVDAVVMVFYLCAGVCARVFVWLCLGVLVC